MGNIVAIVGRPNVGKSTLFNRLIGERQAIIDDVSGVTRDRQYGETIWNGKTFNVIDTGGFVLNSEDVFEVSIRSQVQIAMDEASVIIFMVDATTGITDLDEQMAAMLRKAKKQVILAVNKVDNFERQIQANEFWSLGFEQTFFLSSMNGSGSGDLLDEVAEHIDNIKPIETPLPKFAIIGQPNVGKSSFVNALIGEERNIVTEIAGTTRDAIHTRYSKYEKDFYLIDTAGIRKKAKVHENLEFYSVMRAIKAIEEADVCFLIVDATLGVEAQDLKIFRLAQKRNKGVVLLVNKWDLVEKETNTAKEFEDVFRDRLSPFSDLPIIFMSALSKQRILKAIEAGISVFENRNRKVSTSLLNELLQEAVAKYPPPSVKGRLAKIKYVTQLPTYYPAFAFFCNNPKYVKDSYKQYLENFIRKRFDFSGVPIGIFIRKK